MRKKMVLVLLSGILGLSSSLTAFAAPRTMPDGTVFDAEYYAQTNPDVAAIYGTDENTLYQHFMNLGKAEGRKASLNNAENAAPKTEVRIECLTVDLPVFSPEVTAQNSILVPVVLESTDGQYLCGANVVTRTEYTKDGRRKDYSNDPIYLALRDYIVEWLINNGDDESNRSINIPIRFVCRSTEDSLYFANLANNLSIDLNKSDLCKNKTLSMATAAADGRWYITKSFGYEELFLCNIDYWKTPEELFNENIKEEIPINPTTGLPAKEDDSWISEDGTIYMLISSC